MTASINGTGLSYVAASPATGARDLSIATMQKFADEFQMALGQSSWQKLPSGLIVQWGTIPTTTGSGVVVTFPMAFPTAVLAITLGTDTTGAYLLTYQNKSKTAFAAQGWVCSTGSQLGVAGSWMAIGY